ncbi:Nn.00g049640.m01.CDS01 [Neocucurbitaria sp. VM-36]
MSPGNPFRASQSYKQTASSPVPQTSFIKPDSSVPEARGRESDYVLEDAVAPPPKTKKSVRIESSTTFIPPHPDTDDGRETRQDPLFQRLTQSQHAPSSPPVASAGFSNSPAATTPNAHDASERYNMAATDALRSSPRPFPEKLQTTFPPSSAPANPFSKTLASLEPSQTASGEDRTATERTTPGNNRTSLDVESFKNLLLTGKSTPRSSVQPPTGNIVPTALSGSHFESSSSTDTSSISRQSLFEPPQEVHAESPRTSYEMAESEEDEQMGLVSEVKKGKKKPPPAPKHRHGKLVTPRQPQVVSFDSFAATEPTSSPVMKTKDNSDTNKLLPPTPVVSPPPFHISTQDTTTYQPSPVQPRASEPLAPSEAPTPQKRTPPPVPLARRQSQLRSSGTANRSRSNSSLTMSSQHSIEPVPSPVPSNQDPMVGAKSPPPPPPSRHGARLPNLSSSSANSSSTELPQRSDSTRTATSAQGPLSRRSTIDSDFEPSSPSPGVNRTSSISSNRNTSRVVSNESTGSVMPPPPPPPRRRQSNRSSFDQQRPYNSSASPTESRRTSMENKRTSLDSKRRTSVASESSLRREYAPADEKGGNEYALYSPKEESESRSESSDAVFAESRGDSSNILDDMERFQREIEELRLRFK